MKSPKKSEQIGKLWVHTYCNYTEWMWVTEVTEWRSTGWADLRGTPDYAKERAEAFANHSAAVDWALHAEGML